jgi:mRNA-degrading endonuclease toxin of MazEF toxin-antitoxin module
LERFTEQLCQGSIVWGAAPDPKGNTKIRPLVVITATNEILLDGPVVAVAITTTYPKSVPHTHVELPWAPHRHPTTMLAKRSAAVCDWLVELRPSQVVEIKGYVPTKTMFEIVKRTSEHNT